MIRPLKQTDYTSVKHLFHDLFDLSEDPKFFQSWIHRSRSIGFFDRGVLVGAAIVRKTFLDYIFVSPLYQNAGIGSQLLRSVLKVTPNIHLLPVDDAAVQKWYFKYGFHLSVQDGDYRVFTRHTHALRSLMRGSA
jgi:GNAT superfamily N-acetyltransferase